MTDETIDDDKEKKKPVLKDLNDYKHPDEKANVVDFQKKEEGKITKQIKV